jgi:S1-C subfamily serine protease
MEDTPASRGKLLAGDVIVEVKGTAVRNAAHFQKIIELLPSEELKLPLTLIRDGSRRQIDVTF